MQGCMPIGNNSALFLHQKSDILMCVSFGDNNHSQSEGLSLGFLTRSFWIFLNSTETAINFDCLTNGQNKFQIPENYINEKHSNLTMELEKLVFFLRVKIK